MPCTQPRRRSPKFSCMMIIACIIITTSSTACSTTAHEQHSKSHTSLLDIIWQPFPPMKRVMPPQDQNYSQLMLSRWIESCSDFKYKVTEEQYLWLEPDYSAWSAIAKSYANMLASSEYKEKPIELDCDVQGYHPLSVWSIELDGINRYVAISMTDSPVPGSGGRRLFGRFELKRLREK